MLFNIKAAKDALMKYFMQERPIDTDQLPSQLEDDALTFFNKGKVEDTPPII